VLQLRAFHRAQSESPDGRVHWVDLRRNFIELFDAAISEELVS
jgi:hypothetical protein